MSIDKQFFSVLFLNHLFAKTIVKITGVIVSFTSVSIIFEIGYLSLRLFELLFLVIL